VNDNNNYNNYNNNNNNNDNNNNDNDNNNDNNDNNDNGSDNILPFPLRPEVDSWSPAMNSITENVAVQSTKYTPPKCTAFSTTFSSTPTGYKVRRPSGTTVNGVGLSCDADAHYSGTAVLTCDGTTFSYPSGCMLQGRTDDQKKEELRKIRASIAIQDKIIKDREEATWGITEEDRHDQVAAHDHLTPLSQRGRTTKDRPQSQVEKEEEDEIITEVNDIISTYRDMDRHELIATEEWGRTAQLDNIYNIIRAEGVDKVKYCHSTPDSAACTTEKLIEAILENRWKTSNACAAGKADQRVEIGGSELFRTATRKNPNFEKCGTKIDEVRQNVVEEKQIRRIERERVERLERD
jgi:hypothetical protein